MHRLASISDDRDMQPRTKEGHHPKSSFAVILSIVLDRHGGFPIQVRDAFE